MPTTTDPDQSTERGARAEVIGRRCDRCRYWRAAPYRGDTMRGHCDWAEHVAGAAAPYWVAAGNMRCATDGRGCGAFSLRA